MVRKLALAVSLALGTLSVPVHALGLGELSSKSTLNQNFKGDITLLSVQPDELDSVRVKLADAEAFERAGVERPFYLSLLKFEPTLTGGGDPVVRITSEFPIREPFLNFLVEVNWPNGRLLREYTVLLDPPVTTTRRPPKVTPAARTAAPVATPTPAAPVRSAPVQPQQTAPVAPTVAAAPGEYGPVKANDTAWRIASRLRPDGVSMEQMMMALLAANPEAFIDGNINRLKRGKILRVPAVTEIQQLDRQAARQAYRQQQDQWLARRDARLQARAENTADTTGAVEAPAGDAEDDQLRIATARPEGEGEAGASEDDALSPTATDLASRLLVARENAETSRQESETLRSQVDDLQVRLEDMQKLLSLKDEQLARLQDRVAVEELTAEAETAEPVVEKSSEVESVVEAASDTPDGADVQLANQIDTGTADTGGDPVEQVMAEAEVAAADQLAVEDTPSQGVSDLPYAQVLNEDFVIADVPPQVDPDLVVEQAAGESAAPVGEELVVGEVSPADEIVLDLAAEEPAAAKEEPASSEVVLGTPAEEVVVDSQTTAAVNTPATPRAASPLIPASLAGMVEQNIVPIAGGGVALLALIGWLATRGRRKTSEATEPLLAGAGAPAELPPAEVEDLAVDQPVANDTLSDLPDSAFLDEFSPSDINTLQDETGEVDPVSEADVYIAYGRYQQAEDLLRQAMDRDPDRLALKHKLLEVHYATRNADAFAVLAQEMVDAGQDTVDEDAWVRAQDMGRELAPSNPLFESKNEGDMGSVAAVGAAAAVTAGTIDDDTLSLNDLELSELNDEYDMDKDPVSELDTASEVSVTLDLDDPLEAGGSTASNLDIGKEPESISLDELESLDFEMPEAETKAAGSADDSSFDLSSETIDIDSMMTEAEAVVDADDTEIGLESEFSAEELQAQLDELSDLSVLDSDLSEKPQTTEASAPLGLDLEDKGTAADELDAPLELDTAFDTADLDGSTDDTLDFADGLNDSQISEDEVATKLDLARAYVEMGDEEGARSILEEVLAEGSAEQKGDAEKLIADLA